MSYSANRSRLPREVSGALNSLCDSPAAPAQWGVEVLKGVRWELLRTGWLRRTAEFATYNEAVEAAVETWRRHDCAARPIRLDGDNKKGREG